MPKPANKKPESIDDRLDRLAIEEATTALIKGLAWACQGDRHRMVRTLTMPEARAIATNVVTKFILKRAEQHAGADLDKLVAELAGQHLMM